MFGKRKCPNCSEKISNSYNFCPYCRAPTKEFFEEDSENWGLLGKDDSPENSENMMLPSGLGSLFNTLLKSLNNQVRELEELERPKKTQDKNNKSKIRKGGISISIHTSEGKPPMIKVASFGNMPNFKKNEEKMEETVKPIQLPSSNSKKFAGLPKEEPKTNIRRFSDKVIYEINMPGVKSADDISISQLEKSIEIKALGKGKVFNKIIPINLPIKRYNFSKKKLTLELDAE
ncbi:MAG: hypothetical protein WDZ69_02405 [Candidatus Pacearchaeota archaeon]